MNKKYLSYIIFVLIAILVIWGKGRQTKEKPDRKKSQGDDPAMESKIRRLSGNLNYSRHARCRMECRHIDASEIKEVLESGVINHARIEESDKGISVPLEGETHDRQHVRIVVSPKKDQLVLVTVIDLDTDWPCDCP